MAWAEDLERIAPFHPAAWRQCLDEVCYVEAGQMNERDIRSQDSACGVLDERVHLYVNFHRAWGRAQILRR